MKNRNIKVPSGCLFCGAPWVDGSQVPGKKMKVGLRVFYKCGASLSVTNNDWGSNSIITKNCIKNEITV